MHRANSIVSIGGMVAAGRGEVICKCRWQLEPKLLQNDCSCDYTNTNDGDVGLDEHKQEDDNHDDSKVTRRETRDE